MATDGKQHLSLVICGHVDSGKSTTTGRLLFELGGIPERELEKLKGALLFFRCLWCCSRAGASFCVGVLPRAAAAFSLFLAAFSRASLPPQMAPPDRCERT